MSKNRKDFDNEVIEHIAVLKESDKYFFNKLANIEIVVHDVINKKIKYQSKKNFKTPKDLLEDIQKKQRQYLLLYQKKESKKYSKK